MAGKEKSIDMRYAKRRIKCNCGHLARGHYLREGCCNECGCTWYWPNDKWLKKQAETQGRTMR
jgi:ubiquitin C-terminal hydrolase